METTKQQLTIGEMVANDYRTAAVFNKYGIDFCCGGNKTLDEVCQEQGRNDVNKIIDDLQSVDRTQGGKKDRFKDWPLDKLCDHIVRFHHKYVEEQMHVIRQLLEKLCKVHGKRHPELFNIYELFLESSGQMAMHMKKEELVLFPYIRKLVLYAGTKGSLDSPHFGSVSNPISIMRNEHDAEGERFRKIAALSNNYTPPADACNTYVVTYSFLKEFEEDLHLHVHLENNILFPGAQKLEEALNN